MEKTAIKNTAKEEMKLFSDNIFGIVISKALIIMLHAPHPKYNEWYFHLQVEINVGGSQFTILKYPLLYVDPMKWGKRRWK